MRNCLGPLSIQFTTKEKAVSLASKQFGRKEVLRYFSIF